MQCHFGKWSYFLLITKERAGVGGFLEMATWSALFTIQLTVWHTIVTQQRLYRLYKQNG